MKAFCFQHFINHVISEAFYFLKIIEFDYDMIMIMINTENNKLVKSLVRARSNKILALLASRFNLTRHSAICSQLFCILNNMIKIIFFGQKFLQRNQRQCIRLHRKDLLRQL